MTVRVIACFLPLLAGLLSAEEAKPAVPDMTGPLAVRSFGKSTITLANNGYFLIERNGKTLADGGLFVFDEGYKGFAFQKRRPKDRGPMTKPDRPNTLVFDDLLYRQVTGEDRIGFEPICEYHEEATFHDDRVDFAYSVKTLEELRVEHIGIYLNLPWFRYANQSVGLFPGFTRAQLPEQIRQSGFLLDGKARIACIAPDRPDQSIGLVLPEARRWWLTDQRAYRLNVYRLHFDVPLQSKGLPAGFEFSLSFSVNETGFASMASDESGVAALRFTERGECRLEVAGAALVDGWPTLVPTSVAAAPPVAPKVEQKPPAELATQKGKAATYSGAIPLDDESLSEYWFVAPTGLNPLTPGSASRAAGGEVGVTPSGVDGPAPQRLKPSLQQGAAPEPEGTEKPPAGPKACSASLALWSRPTPTASPGFTLLLNPRQVSGVQADSAKPVEDAGGAAVHLAAEEGKNWSLRVENWETLQHWRNLPAFPGCQAVAISAAAKRSPSGWDQSTLKLGFDVPEPKQAAATQIVSTDRPEEYKPIASAQAMPLPPDRETGGDWIGNYGGAEFILCGMYGAMHPGVTYSRLRNEVPYAFYSGAKDDTARIWLSGADTDRRVLFDPFSNLPEDFTKEVVPSKPPKRVPAIWDDHGEVYKEGPSLYVDLVIPEGLFVLAAYIYEIDWNQFRRYEVSLRSRTWPVGKNPERQKGEVLGSQRVEDLFHGAYVRFLVRGPVNAQLEVARRDSPNAVLSGIFLDPVVPPYVLSHTFAYSPNKEMREIHQARMEALVQAHAAIVKAPSGGMAPLQSAADALAGLIASDGSSSEIRRTHDLLLEYLRSHVSLAPPSERLKRLSQYCEGLKRLLETSDFLPEMAFLVRHFTEHRDFAAAATCSEFYLSSVAPDDSSPAVSFELFSLASDFWRKPSIRRGYLNEIQPSHLPDYRSGRALLGSYVGHLRESHATDREFAEEIQAKVEKTSADGRYLTASLLLSASLELAPSEGAALDDLRRLALSLQSANQPGLAVGRWRRFLETEKAKPEISDYQSAIAAARNAQRPLDAARFLCQLASMHPESEAVAKEFSLLWPMIRVIKDHTEAKTALLAALKKSPAMKPPQFRGIVSEFESLLEAP